MRIVSPPALLFSFVFLTSLLLIESDRIGAQIGSNVTDANFADFSLNPDNYVDADVSITGKIFNLVPSSGNTGSFQIYQGGDIDRNVLISYEISQLGPFSEDDCVSIVGTSRGSYQYANAFGGEVSAPLIDASSITKIECSEVMSPSQKSIIVEQTQTKSGIKFTLHKVEFSDKNTRAYLTVENNNKNTEISFYDFNSKAIQGNRQFETTTDYEVEYPEIVSDIPAGIVEDGVVLFEPLSYDKGNIKLQFEAGKNYQDINFDFNIDPLSEQKQGPDDTSPDTTAAPEIVKKSTTDEVESVSNDKLKTLEQNSVDSNTISSNGEFSLLNTWGSTGIGEGQFNHPASIENDLNGQRIYIADLDNNRIQVLDSDGEFITKWGSAGNGDGQFNGPGSVAVDDGKKVVFVSDIRNNRIQKFDLEGDFITKWGTLGKQDGEFDHPGDIALNPDEGTLYVTDIYNNRIQKFDYNGTYITKWGSLGEEDNQFNRPAGITMDTGNDLIYVADTANNRISVFDAKGNFIDKWGTLGSGNSQFNRPDGIYFDSINDLVYVSDRKNNRIMILDDKGGFVSELSLPQINKDSIKPRDVALDLSGNIFILDKVNNNIKVFSGLKASNDEKLMDIEISKQLSNSTNPDAIVKTNLSSVVSN